MTAVGRTRGRWGTNFWGREKDWKWTWLNYTECRWHEEKTMKGQCKGPMRETKRRGNKLAYTTVMIDSIKVRIEQSDPIGPSRFHYRDTKDHLISRSNFTRKIKKNQIELDYLFVILREFRRKKTGRRDAVFSLYRTRCTRIRRCSSAFWYSLHRQWLLPSCWRLKRRIMMFDHGRSRRCLVGDF